MSTFTTLLVVPHLFVWVRRKAGLKSVSLDPDDAESRYAKEEVPYVQPSLKTIKEYK
jgi:hypothetical protein